MNMIKAKAITCLRPAGIALLFHWLALFAAGYSCAAPGPPPLTPPKGEDILIINSYHRGYIWSDNETDGILSVLAKGGISGEPLIEYLDSKRMAGQEHFDLQRDLLRLKLKKFKPSLVMTLDNPAFDFALTYRRELFPDVPLVFVGLNEFDPSMLRGGRNVSGIVERQDFLGTVKAALAMHPGTREIIVLHDYTPSGLATRNEATDQLAQFAGTVAIRFLPEMTIDEIIASLNKTPQGSLLLAVSFSRDKAGKVFNHSSLAEILSSRTRIPVYSTKVERLGYGIVGGSLMDGRSHGALGGSLAVRVLNGEPADSLPVITNPPSNYFFDYRQLKRFKISESRLPEGSTVIERPPNFYSEHRQVINISAVIIGILAACLVMVLAANTKRKSAETALTEAERYRFLFDNASDAIVIIDPRGRFLEVNAIASGQLGYGHDQLLGMSFSDIVPPDFLERIQSIHEELPRTSGHITFETAHRKPGGELAMIEVSSRSIEYRGKPAILCSLRDTTKRKQTEEEIVRLNTELEERVIKRTRQLAQANEEMESFCYSVSHDLRAPLRHINGYSSILIDEYGPLINDSGKDYLARLCRASNNMGMLIEDLLKLSHISRHEMVSLSVDLSSIAREISDELQQGNTGRAATFIIPETPPARGDSRLLRVVLFNLIENAWKYTGRKDNAVIEFGSGNIRGETAYYVKDNGAGFDMTYSNKLFGAFQRLHRADDFEGTGIGLATVQRVIHRHGGRVWGEGKPGEGATFWFTLGS